MGTIKNVEKKDFENGKYKVIVKEKYFFKTDFDGELDAGKTLTLYYVDDENDLMHAYYDSFGYYEEAREFGVDIENLNRDYEFVDDKGTYSGNWLKKQGVEE